MKIGGKSPRARSRKIKIFIQQKRRRCSRGNREWHSTRRSCHDRLLLRLCRRYEISFPIVFHVRWTIRIVACYDSISMNPVAAIVLAFVFCDMTGLKFTGRVIGRKPMVIKRFRGWKENFSR